MWTRMVIISSLALLVLPVLVCAQATQPGAGDRALVGEVIGDNVYIRSGPSVTGAYRCAKISKPAKVTVIEAKEDWLKILPTEGCYSVISKKFVQPDASGSIGTVKGDNVLVRAGGDLCPWDEVTLFSHLQRRVNAGQKVKILGSGGDFYKVAPPDGAYFWISAKYVNLGGRRPAEYGSVEVRTVNAGATRPSREVVAHAPQEEATTSPTVDPNSAWGQWENAETEMRAEYSKKIEQRDLKGLIAKYQAINTSDDENLKKLVDYRVKYFQAQIDQYKEAQEMERWAANFKGEIEKSKVAADKATTRVVGQLPKAYDADGVLVASGLFTGAGALPKRWTVRDPDTNRITAYVQCSTGDVDLDQYLGKHVGITGSTQYDKDMRLYIVEAKEVKVLSNKSELPTPPQPELKPLPKSEESAETDSGQELPQPPAQEKPKLETEPASKPAEPSTEPVEEKPAPAGTSTQPVRPDMGSDELVAPDALPTGEPSTESAGGAPEKATPTANDETTTAPANKEEAKPVVESKTLPATGLDRADDRD